MNDTSAASSSSGPTLTSSDIVAVTALIISIAALLTTILQVLQQYLASAEGYRRCAPSVIGEWSVGTKRKFRRRELRFEVVFETPVLFLAPPGNERGPIPKRQILNIDGSDKSYKDTNTLKPPADGGTTFRQISTASDDERASWVILLEAIQKEEADSRNYEATHRETPRGNKYPEQQYTICHQIQKKTRSYDFMPPSVTKPYATTTISHLVEMVGMLGMSWKAFEDVRGNVRAEGNGYILTSTLAQGLGLVVTFSVTGRSDFGKNRVIPTHDIKELVFGFVPNQILGIPLEVGHIDRVKETLASIKCSTELEAYKDKKDRKNMFSVTFEFVAMVAQPFRIQYSNLRMLPNPTPDKWPGEHSVIRWLGEMIQFQEALQTMINSELTNNVAPHPLLVSISELWQEKAKIENGGEKSTSDGKSMMDIWVKASDLDSTLLCDIDLDQREQIHKALKMVDDELLKTDIFPTVNITSVVASHIAIVLERDDLAVEMNTAGVKSHGKLMRYYFKNILPKVEADLPNPTDEAKAQRRVIWLTLMFRMICWFCLHDFIKNDVNKMDGALKGSRMPVFIG